ncbi:MAG: hypothetical protein M3019_10495 [Candidatus Dormibacteraeota bacterium]|nr:hypothetical protein [Candidatus Dormibacteraeota bacterium]
MYGNQITELWQIREQENMLERAARQARREGRFDVPAEHRAARLAWLVTFHRTKKPRSTSPRCSQHAAPESGGG